VKTIITWVSFFDVIGGGGGGGRECSLEVGSYHMLRGILCNKSLKESKCDKFFIPSFAIWNRHRLLG
jgi:hypothetical protein